MLLAGLVYAPALLASAEVDKRQGAPYRLVKADTDRVLSPGRRLSRCLRAAVAAIPPQTAEEGLERVMAAAVADRGFRPLKMLPLVLFEIGYKLIWLMRSTWPSWAANRLTGSPTEDMTYAFLPVVGPIVLVPWEYVWRTYGWTRR